jgi:hypothetical protein
MMAFAPDRGQGVNMHGADDDMDNASDDYLDEEVPDSRRNFGKSERWDPYAEEEKARKRDEEDRAAIAKRKAEEEKEKKKEARLALVRGDEKNPPMDFNSWLVTAGVNRAQTYGLVEAVFNQGESPLGLIMDWSMPLPVIAGILPGHPAKKHVQLEPGLVLIHINGKFLLGLEKHGRAEVEKMLNQRPLHLVFESPLPWRFVGIGGENVPQPWQRTGPSQTLVPSKSQGSAGMTMTHATGGFMNTAAGSTMHSFLEQHPERAPLARFNLHMPSDMEQLPSLLKPGARGQQGATSHTSLPRITSLTDKSFRTMAPGDTSRSMMRTHKSNSITGSSWRGHGGSVQRLPDRCYEHLLDQVNAIEKPPGPGATSRWPLDHSADYVCHMSDLRLCRKVREAYENGFQGRKRERPDHMHILMYKNAPPRRASVIRTDQPVWCDICGEDVAKTDVPGIFWFCRVCKRNGNRFEICVSCHAIEVLQGEGKHAGEGRHPHFLSCEHRQVVEWTDLREAYPAAPQLRRLFCDYCGDLIRFRAEDFSGKAATIYVCPRCPKEHGLRFELCKRCALALRDHGHGIRSLLDK